MGRRDLGLGEVIKQSWFYFLGREEKGRNKSEPENDKAGGGRCMEEGGAWGIPTKLKFEVEECRGLRPQNWGSWKEGLEWGERNKIKYI